GADPKPPVRVLLVGRPWVEIPCPGPLSLRAIASIDERLEPAEALPDSWRERIGAGIEAAGAKLLDRAVADLRTGYAAVLHALGGGRGTDAIRAAKVYPCTDGENRSATELSMLKPVEYVTEPISGARASGVPVVFAQDPLVFHALRRFSSIDNVTVELRRELSERKRHEALPAVERISVREDSRHRRALP